MSVSPNVVNALVTQGLTVADLEANRAGRVSPKQLELLGAISKAGAIIAYGLVAVMSGGSTTAAVYHYTQHGQPAIFILPTVASTFVACIYFFVWRMNRLPSPAQVKDAPVTHLRTRTGGSMVSGSRGMYNVWLDRVRYTGCSGALSTDVWKKESLVDAYVLAEHQVVLALIPAE